MIGTSKKATLTFYLDKKIPPTKRWRSKRSWKRWERKSRVKKIYRKLLVETPNLKLPFKEIEKESFKANTSITLKVKTISKWDKYFVRRSDQ